jgi:hypothetical protein
MISIGERRLVRVAIAFELLANMMTEGWNVGPGVYCAQGLPTDAMLVNSTYSDEESCTYLVFAHSSFAPVAEGHPIPIHNIVHGIVQE